MKIETILRLRLISANAESLIKWDHDKDTAYDKLYEMKNEIDEIIQELRTDR